MTPEHFVIMGAGEVGCYLARALSAEGHRVTVIDGDPAKRQFVEEQLDVRFLLGNAAHIPVLEAAGVGQCSLFVAVSSSDEGNLAASLLAKQAGAPRTVVRVGTSEDVTRFGRKYEQAFRADLLLSTQLLTTTRILNSALGYNTLDVEYLASGALQVRRTQVEAGSALHEKCLEEVDMPDGSLVLAFISEGRLHVPSGGDQAQPGDDALFIATSDVIDEVERRLSGHSQRLGAVVVAGGGSTAEIVSEGLAHQARLVQIIERDRSRAEELAAKFPDFEIIHGDATDMTLLASEGIGRAQIFLALTGNDETNLMACLLAQELGVSRMTALVQKSETSSLWRKVGLVDVVSPRTVAVERIRSYIENGYEPHIVSFENDAAQFMQRRVDRQSPAVGERLADVEVPQGLMVAAVLSHGKAIVPTGDYRLQAGQDVILFVRQAESALAQLVFPGLDAG